MNVRENSTWPAVTARVGDPDRPPGRAATAPLEGLLAAVVAACHCMVQHSDLKTGLKAAVAQLGQLSGHDRAYVWELVDDQRVCELVAEWDAPGVGCISEMADIKNFAVADYLEVWQPLLAGSAYQSITPLKSGANARFNELVDNRSDVMVPIFVGDICWGCIGFDNCREERRYSDAEIQALRGAAAAVAAAVQRSRAEAQVQAEEQRQRQLLAAVNEASAHLVTHSDLNIALSRAVESLRVHTGVDRVFINRYAPPEQSTYFWTESRRPGVPAFTDGFGPGPWPDDQFAEVAHPLREGRVYRSVSSQRGGANAAANTANGSRSDLIVPIMVDGEYRACIGFDDNTHARAWSDAEVAVLQTAAHAVAGALARHAADAARQQAERARADRAEADVVALRAREGLLHSVTDVARSLLATLDFDAGVDAAMALLGRVLPVDRVGLVRDTTPPGDVGLGTWQLTHEWAAPGLPKQLDSPAATGTNPSEDWLHRSRAGEAVVLQIGHNEPGFDEGQRAVEVATSLSVPVFVRGTWWGIFGFDDARARTWLPHEVAVLQTATACIGAALERQLADAERQRADRDRAEAAEADARELRAREGLLQTVTRAARQLLAGPDLDASINETLALLGSTFQTTRAGLVQDLGPSSTGAPARWRMTHEWRAPGIPPQIGSAAEAGDHPSEEWALRSRAGEPVVLRVGDGQENFDLGQRAIATRTILSVPVFVDGRWWGVVGFDDAVPDRQWAPHEIAVLQVAASCLGAALEREQAEAQRLAVAQAHTAQAEALAVLTQGVVRATRDLLDAPDFNAGVQAWLAHLGQAAMADLALLINIPSDGEQQRDEVATWASGWRRDGQRIEDLKIPSTTDFDAWLARLQAQQPVWACIDELVDPRSVQWWLDTDCASNLLMPVALDGTVRYVLCFDWREHRPYSAADEAVLRTAAESFAAVVARQRAADAMLAERERRVLAEAERARDAQKHAARTERHSRLLAAVAASAEELLAAEDVFACVERVLERIGTVTQADRACLAWLTWTPDDAEVLGWQEIRHEWTRPGAVRQRDGWAGRFAMYRDDPTWALVEEQLARDGRVLGRMADLTEPFRSEQMALGVVWTLAYPMVVGGQTLALLGFDYATDPDDYDEADLGALQTVASTLADAHWRQELEARALAAERARADENARLASLLSQVVASSRMLIDAGPSGFEAALRSWLGALGDESQAIRATFYDLVHHAEARQDTVRMLCEWVREGIGGSVPCSFAQPFVIDPRGAEDLMHELTAGRLATFHTEQTEGVMRAFLEGQGNASVVVVPVLAAGRPWGAVSFDYAARREIGSADAAILQTAADTLSAVLRRNEAAAALLAEREGRLLSEQRRSTELTRSNAALRQSLDALAGTDGEGGFLRDALLQLQTQSGALSAYLFRAGDADTRLRLVGRATAGQFSEQPAQDDPEIFFREFNLDPELFRQLRTRGNILWRKVDPDMPITADTSQSTLWHLRMGHKANAVHALMVGERQVGFIGMLFDTPEPPSAAVLDQAHALCQAITLALELTRLSRLAQRSSEQTAMLKERNRLAREIHDGIAQSFLAIQMQLDKFDVLGADAAGPVKKALEMSRHGLAEARRAVAALRPQGLQDSGLPGGIQRLLSQFSAGSAVECSLVSSPGWQALPGEVEDHLYRIVQEALNNAQRHARARSIRVELSQAAGETTVLIADDGVGFDMAAVHARRGFGLESMQQRAQLIGARIDWLSHPGRGTQVLLSWTPP